MPEIRIAPQRSTATLDAAPLARHGSGVALPIQVVVADDNERYRAGIVRALDRCAGVEVVGQAGDGREALILPRAEICTLIERAVPPVPLGARR